MSQEEIIVAVVVAGIVIGLAWGISALVQRKARGQARASSASRDTVEPEWGEDTPSRVVILEPASTLRPALDHIPEPKVRLGEPRQIKLIAPITPTQPQFRRGAPLRVQVRNEPLWQVKGWRQDGNTYRGQFRVNGRSWPGQIDSPYDSSFQAYIWNPPLPEIESRTLHRPCFQPSTRGGESCYHVHYHTMPVSLDHAITTIEAVLAEAVGH